LTVQSITDPSIARLFTLKLYFIKPQLLLFVS